MPNFNPINSIKSFADVVKNLANLARVVNNLDNNNIAKGAKIHHSKIDFTGFDFSTIFNNTETPVQAMVLRDWVIRDNRVVMTDKTYRATDVQIGAGGDLTVNGDLVIG